MKQTNLEQQDGIRYDIPWTTLGEYLEYLEHKGISPNIASFVGATTVRVHEIGYDDRPPTPEELDRMRALVRQAMEEGALGVGSSLIYAPAFYAETEELIELCKVAAEYGGMYISHMRSEGDRLLEAIDELIRIAREAGLPGRDLPPQGVGQGELGKDGRRDRQGRGGARRRACASPRTCTPTSRARPGSTPPCRPGCRRAGSTPGSSA